MHSCVGCQAGCASSWSSRRSVDMAGDGPVCSFSVEFPEAHCVQATLLSEHGPHSGRPTREAIRVLR